MSVQLNVPRSGFCTGLKPLQSSSPYLFGVEPMVDMLPPVDALAVTLAAAGVPVAAATPQVSATALKTPRSTLDLAPCTCNRALISCAPLAAARPRHSRPNLVLRAPAHPRPRPPNTHIATVFINLLPANRCNLYWILVDPVATSARGARPPRQACMMVRARLIGYPTPMQQLPPCRFR